MVNYFTLFGIAETFDLDASELSTKYQTLQKLTHPDRFASESEQQQRIALQKNAQVSDGYQVLKSPLKRAEHLLALRGLTLDGETQTMQDMDFLMQQMQWREMLSELDQAADPDAVIDELYGEIEQQFSTLYGVVREMLKGESDEQNQRLADTIRKLKFIDKLQREVEEKESQRF